VEAAQRGAAAAAAERAAAAAEAAADEFDGKAAQSGSGRQVEGEGTPGGRGRGGRAAAEGLAAAAGQAEATAGGGGAADTAPGVDVGSLATEEGEVAGGGAAAGVLGALGGIISGIANKVCLCARARVRGLSLGQERPGESDRGRGRRHMPGGEGRSYVLRGGFPVARLVHLEGGTGLVSDRAPSARRQERSGRLSMHACAPWGRSSCACHAGNLAEGCAAAAGRMLRTSCTDIHIYNIYSTIILPRSAIIATPHSHPRPPPIKVNISSSPDELLAGGSPDEGQVRALPGLG
jgi:hypothetical protein